MTLIVTGWLSGTRIDGTSGRLGPRDVADGAWRELTAPRPDFRGSVYQFMVGLLQVAFPPTDRDDWRERLANPPSRDELIHALQPFEAAFLLENHGGPAFMQDLHLDDSREATADQLIFEQGTDSGQFFSKPQTDFGLCDACATMALLTLQLNAPSGGRGTRTSLRGGGPITTLVVPRGDDATLWERLWLNVIPTDELHYGSVTELGKVLPWLLPTRRSDRKSDPETMPEDVHPLQAYWSMSRRIRFDWGGAEAGVCGICGTASPRLLRRYQTRHGGTNYGGAWMHPLSPYTIDAAREKPPLARKGQPGGIGYRHWLALTYGVGTDQQPAKVVQGAVHSGATASGLRLWATGGDFDNMKLRAWCDSVMPLYVVPPERQSQFTSEVSEMVVAADATAQFMGARVREAWNTSKSDPTVRQSLWDVTEHTFYETVASIAELAEMTPTTVIPLRRQWLKTLRRQALEQFDHWAACGPIEMVDLRRVVTARGSLTKDLARKKPMKQLWQSVQQLPEEH